MPPGPKRSWTDEQVKMAVKQSTSWRQVMLRLGLKPNGGSSYVAVQRLTTRLELDVGHFAGQGWSRGTGSGRSVERQREAKRRWYRRNRDVYQRRNRDHKEARRRYVRERKSVPCSDCGQKFPYFVMEFDHRPDEIKLFEVARLVSSCPSLKVLKAEIEKCDVVCCTCHRFRTAKRAGWTY